METGSKFHLLLAGIWGELKVHGIVYITIDIRDWYAQSKMTLALLIQICVYEAIKHFLSFPTTIVSNIDLYL